MTAVAQPSFTPSRLQQYVRRNLIFLPVLAACAAFIFADLRPVPIVIWDESRLAVNALEMRLHGLSLVTTYGYAPDLWNTKPPLLIWLMDASLRLFGPTEWAVRFPSMVATLATLVLVNSFTRRVTHSTWAGALAVVLLALSLGFFGEHGARTGDYDALLCLFTTAYLYTLFFALHRRRPAAWRLLLAAGLVACAVLTKSIAGLVPAAGMVLYLVLVRRLRRTVTNPWLIPAAAIGVGPVAGFYLAREASAPGYLAAVWKNDVSGRFLTALDQHGGPPWYYVRATFFGRLFSAGPLALLAPGALPATRGAERLGLTFAVCIAGCEIGIVSASSTKLLQYVLPAFPFLAIATAIAARTGLRRLDALDGAQAGRLISAGRARALLAVTLAFIVADAVNFRRVLLPEREFYPQASYGDLLAGLAKQGVSSVQVFDHGVEDGGVPKGYAPQLRFYSLAWAERGLKAELANGAPRAGPTNVVMASCDPAYLKALGKLGSELPHPKGCMAVQAKQSA